MRRARGSSGSTIESTVGTDPPRAVIVGAQSHTSKFYSYEDAWAHYAENVVGCVALPCGHYPAEQAPDETYTTLVKFFRS